MTKTFKPLELDGCNPAPRGRPWINNGVTLCQISALHEENELAIAVVKAQEQAMTELRQLGYRRGARAWRRYSGKEYRITGIYSSGASIVFYGQQRLKSGSYGQHIHHIGYASSFSLQPPVPLQEASK